MAKFAIMASELKSLKKSMEDRKLAELKKEIIEILKKQDEKDFKKAIDYFNSQELHFTHLEKSLNGKWIEKAGYGVGTVRIWKGKKYKKIAPGKWARVFDKESKGANVAIGRLIAEVERKKSIEELMDFVMAHKQRFVDDNGIDLPILDKLRAAADVKNEKLSGESSPYVYGVGENVNRAKNEMFSKKDKITKEEADLHKVSRKISQVPTAELKQEKARLERAVANKTRNKRDSLNNAIFRESNQQKLDAINKELEKRNNGTADKKTESSNKIEVELLSKEEMKKMTGDKLADYRHKLHEEMKKFDYGDDENFDKVYEVKKIADDIFRNKEFARNEEPEEESKTYWIQDFEGNRITSDDAKKKIKDINDKLEYMDSMKDGRTKDIVVSIDAKKRQLENYRDDLISKLNPEDRKEVESEIKKEPETKDKLSDDAEIVLLNLKDWNKDEAQSILSKKINSKDDKNIDAYKEAYSYLNTHDMPTFKNGKIIDKESEAEKHQNRSDAMKGNKNAYKGGPKDVAKYINSQTNDDKERNSMLVEAFNERYGTGKDKDYAFYSMGELYNDVIQAKPHTDKWYDAMNKYDEAAEMYKMVIGDDEIDYYNREVEKIRMKPNWNKEKLSDSKIEKPLNNDIATKAVSYDELKPIATNKSVGENEVQMPYSKELADEIESLKNCTAPKYDPRETFKHIFYKDGKLITTDARRMKFVEVGELEGIPDGSYVDINTDKSGINVKKIDFNAQFPNYSKVIPDNLNQTATLDTKLVKDKIKEMYKDGAISKKGSNLIQLEFRDGKVFIDDTAVGEAKDIKMKYSDDWGPARNDTNYMTINADYFVNALSGKTSVMQIGERADKAIAINTGSTSNILMPMSGTDKKTDYSKGRSEKEKAKADKAAEIEKNKEFNKELCKVFESKYGYDLVKNMAEHIDERLPSFSDENLQREYTRLGLNFDKLMEKKSTTVNTILDKKTSTDLKTAYLYSRVMKEHPEVKDKIAAELEKRGITVKKSLFDDFIVDVFAADDEEELEEELYAGETEYNDYSAEQPELFNSTSMKVREALDRIRNQVL